jgi:hypothetical protein
LDFEGSFTHSFGVMLIKQFVTGEYFSSEMDISFEFFGNEVYFDAEWHNFK